MYYGIAFQGLNFVGATVQVICKNSENYVPQKFTQILGLGAITILVLDISYKKHHDITTYCDYKINVCGLNVLLECFDLLRIWQLCIRPLSPVVLK